MVYVISFLLYTLGIFTFVQGIRMLRYHTSRRKPYILYSLSAFSSALWSFGFAMSWIQTNFEYARIWRSVGMIGVFLFFLTVTEFFIQWMDGAVLYKAYARIVSVIGIFLWPFVIGEESVTFYHTPLGMTYQFSQNIWNTLYNVICILIALNYFIIIIYIMRRANHRKLRDIMKQMMISCLVVMIGMIFDTVLPAFGYDALPGSTLTQSIGILMLARVMEFLKTSEITVENISKFVYYSVDTPVLIYDEYARFRIANTGAAEFFGKQHDEVMQRNLWEIFSIPRDCMKFSENKRIDEVECLLNNRFCHLEINKIYDEYQEITGYIVVINDLTEKRDFIRRLQESEQAAEMANHAKSDFLARMSHEIRTPINGIIGVNEIILQNSTESRIKDCAKMVKLSANNLLELVNDILDISKIEANHVVLENVEYQLNELLLEASAVAQVKAQEKGLDFQIVIEKALPQTINGDVKKLRQVLLNVVGNAFKYTNKGSVIIQVRGFWKERHYYLQMVIKDTGVGIKAENLEKIFDAFERVDTAHSQGVEGTGLGLSIAKNMVQIMGGTISVSSEYGKGTEFVITVPQEPVGDERFDHLSLDGTVKAKEEQPDAAQRMHLQIPDKRILVVDDNEINRIVASELLSHMKAVVDTAESGEVCLQKVKENCYDIIMLDHLMPGMDGIRVLEELRKMPDNKSRNAVHIMFTANAIQGAREDYLNKGFDDYLSKPINVAQVEEVLEKYCCTKQV